VTTAASADNGAPTPRTTQRARREPVPEAPLAGDPRQPLLHHQVVVAAAPSVLLCDASGDLDAGRPGDGAQGLFHADVRALSRLRLTVGGEAPDSVLGTADGAGRARFVGFARNVGDAVPDPSVRVERMREISPGRLDERIVVSSWASLPVTTLLRLDVGADLLDVDRVKFGAVGRPSAARGEPGRLVWSHGDTRVTLEAPGADLDAASGTVTWPLELAPGAQSVLTWRVDVDDVGAAVTPPPRTPSWAEPRIRADDRRLGVMLRRCLADLHGLRMSVPESPGEVFLAAGAPWFFTLFGRDSLWSARMLLPMGTDLARGTLRVLAARQGREDDPVSEEEPGKILHEVRRDVLDDGQGLRLPPVYYGSIDATPLWVCLLHDAWRWGLPSADVEPLLPHLEAALGWIEATTGEDFVAYSRRNATGLANQGWKDSADAVRFRDGHLGLPPVSLAEVQGYAHEAAVGGAALLDAFGRPGGDRWRSWAARLAERFRAQFWVEDDDGPYPAMALDGLGRPVDAVASNMGHLLGTGLLDEAETQAVADRLASPELAGAYGLRTMSNRANGYGPSRYHCGTVWPHDTAIAVLGLARSGHVRQSADLVDGLLEAAAALPAPLPELWGGDGRDEVPEPVPYPAACRPQAWAAASSVALVTAVLGLDPDVPAGTLAVRPVQPSPVGAVNVEGLRVAGVPLAVRTDSSGALVSVTTDATLRLVP
jgi:glycogen debranching enzyme